MEGIQGGAEGSECDRVNGRAARATRDKQQCALRVALRGPQPRAAPAASANRLVRRVQQLAA